MFRYIIKNLNRSDFEYCGTNDSSLAYKLSQQCHILVLDTKTGRSMNNVFNVKIKSLDI